jgi:hypothetical protein|nr:hypothetical protein [Bradyrhizobium sp.]
MRLPALAVLAVAATLLFVSFASLLLSGCATSLECGSWAFSGTPQSAPGGGLASLANVTSAFTFTPANCGKNCNCNTDAMIQMVSVYDTEEHMYLFDGTGDTNRADANNWTIDRVDGAGYGWYGLLNDGVTFYNFWNTPGSNGTANTLYDYPRQPNNIVFFAVDAAVCFKSESCQNRILGYYVWSWAVDNNGTARELFAGAAWTELETEFQNAIASWNKWAPNSGPETDPVTGQTIPNAVQFPAFSDL